MQSYQIVAFIRAALECSVYVAPALPGLTYLELTEVGRRLGYQPGEINDALKQVDVHENDGPRDHLMPDFGALALAIDFHVTQEPDFRSYDAFDFVHVQMNDAARQAGRDRAALQREVLVERGVRRGLPRHDVEVAVTMLQLRQILRCEAGMISFPPNSGGYASPSEQRRDNPRRVEARRRAELPKIHAAVKDVVARRVDGRPPSSEPFDAFAAALEGLGHGAFRTWWVQTVNELRLCDTQTSSLAATVLAAALVEGALTFVVKRARDLGMATMASKSFEEPPHRWKIDDLVASAAAGRDAAILDNAARQRAEALVRSRQRIHAGRMLSEHPGGPPDLRPEEAREAKATAEMVVRRVLDWLQRYPAGVPSAAAPEMHPGGSAKR